MTDLAIFTGIILTLWATLSVLVVLAVVLQMALSAFKRK